MFLEVVAGHQAVERNRRREVPAIGVFYHHAFDGPIYFHFPYLLSLAKWRLSICGKRSGPTLRRWRSIEAFGAYGFAASPSPGAIHSIFVYEVNFHLAA